MSNRFGESGILGMNVLRREEALGSNSWIKLGLLCHLSSLGLEESVVVVEAAKGGDSLESTR